MKICYVGHAFHERTRSNLFFREIVESMGHVTAFFSDPDAPRGSDEVLVGELAGSNFDCYVFYQTEYLAARLHTLVPGRIIIVPMYDGALGRASAFWQQFVGAEFISFSRAHHELLQSLHCRSAYFQYFPPVPELLDPHPINKGGFFWERRPDKNVNLEVIGGLCRQLQLTELHVHNAPDFPRFARVTEGRLAALDVPGLQVSISRWFERAEDYLAAASRPLFYFAPREFEGIGMAALEAMARGQIVVAADRPALNEYIAHMSTGLLYEPADPSLPEPLGDRVLAEMSARARRKAELMRRDWEVDRSRLKSILLGESRRWSTPDFGSHFLNKLRSSAANRAFDAIPSRRVAGTKPA